VRKRFFDLIVGLLTLGLITSAAAQGKAPNIVVIFGDDIGYMNISSFGGDIMGVQTPNIDRIAKEGIRLTSFYSHPSCTSGRAAFITGQLPVRTGMTIVGLPGSNTGLKKEDLSLAEVLKTKGYATAQFGKNHLGDLEENLPHRRGFDEFWGNLYHLNAQEEPADADRARIMGKSTAFLPRGIVSGTADGKTIDEGPLTAKRMETVDEELLAHSKDFIARQVKANKPFFLWHNTTRMHVFTHLKDSSKGKSRASVDDNYGAGLAEHDQQVGELLKQLDDLGIANNTIVIYTTDNGAYQYMWPEGGQTPFRGDKGTTWEGGVRVPAAVRWPGKIKPGQVSADIIAMEDWFPTLASIAGEPDTVAKLKKGQKYGEMNYKVHLDGFDQTDFLTGKSPKSARNYVFYYDEASLAAVRMGPWKISIASKRGGKWDDQLQPYGRPNITNLLMDPFERQDGDVNRAWTEAKGWVYMPVMGLLQLHLESFKEFPPRQVNISGDVTKMIWGTMQQINAAATTKRGAGG
jgi:arylsulfatase A-like enzyme